MFVTCMLCACVHVIFWCLGFHCHAYTFGSNEMSCDCSSSRYVYDPAGHLVTGNLHIVENRHIRELLVKGPSYREQNNITWCKIDALGSSTKVQSTRRERIDIRMLNECVGKPKY